MIRRLTLLATLAAGTAAAQVSLEAPVGGWKHSGGEPVQYMQDVNYPASRVNAGAMRENDDGQGLGAAIRGRIARTASEKSHKPHLLVVNGIPMPLSVGPDGGFARPYSFPPGNNSVEIRTPDRKQVRRTNFYDNNEHRQRVGLRVVLSWDSDMTDIDLHVISPDGEHVFYGHRTGRNGGALDVDVTGGYGPEIYAIPSPPKGNWHIYLNYYGGDEGNRLSDGITIAQVAIITREGTPDEKSEIFRVPLRRPGDLTLVRSFLLQ